MSRIVSTDMVAHLWAHQSCDNACNKQDNFYFRRGTIFSYRDSFPCGVIAKNRHGHKVFILNRKTYSTTTAKHMNIVRDAVPGYETVFHTYDHFIEPVDGLLSAHEYDSALCFIVEHIDEIDTLLHAQKKAKRKDYTGDIRNEIDAIRKWIEFWGLDKKQKSRNGDCLPPALSKLCSPQFAVRDPYYTENKRVLYGLLKSVKDMGMLDPSNVPSSEMILELCAKWTDDKSVADRVRKMKALLKTIDTKRQKAKIAEFNRKRKKWLCGEIANYQVRVPEFYNYNAILRVEDGVVETSMGVRIASEEAGRLWKMIQLFHEKPDLPVRGVVRDIDNHGWELRSFRDEVLTAGCHRLHLSDMAYAARQLGLTA